RSAKDFVHVSKVECCAMLSIAKYEIGESSAERVKVVRKGTFEPVDALFAVCRHGTGEVGNDQPNTGSRFENSETFLEKSAQFVIIKMLEHVGGIDRVGGT